MGGATRLGSELGLFVLRGLELQVGRVLRYCTCEEDGLLAGCCLLRGLAGRDSGPAERLDVHWFSSGIGHDTDIDGEQENADG